MSSNEFYDNRLHGSLITTCGHNTFNTSLGSCINSHLKANDSDLLPYNYSNICVTNVKTY